MFTSWDKALVALVMAALALINFLWGVDWFGHLTEGTVAVVIAVLTPVLVFLWPNLAPGGSRKV